MRCPKCGSEVPEGARFCPNCGFGGEVESAPARLRKRSPIIYAIGALAVIAILALVFTVFANRGNVTNPSASGPLPTGNVTNAPAGLPGDGNVTNAPQGIPPTGQATPTSTPKPKPPQAVVDYLAFLKRVEEIRNTAIVDKDISAIAGSVIGRLVGQMTGEQSDESEKDELSKSADAMLIVLHTFDKATAPSECRELSGVYRQLLYVETDALYQMSSMLNSLSSDSKANWIEMRQQEMRRNLPKMNSNAIQLVNKSNEALDRLVSSYDMQKPFTVSQEGGSGGSLTDILSVAQKGRSK
ncbi:MAG: zinc-ribbon domain-containing protein [Armatimonadota bacterium]|nr:zinc-ribbon domain-containing protein [bacterium]